MFEDKPLFVQVVLPVPIPNYFTYSVPNEWAETILPGVRVIVPFGSKKILTAIVLETSNIPPTRFETKPILEVLDETPVVNKFQRTFFEWISTYYMCFPGDVLSAAIPSGLRLSSESFISLSPNIIIDPEQFTDNELLILNQLTKKLSANFDQVAAWVKPNSPAKIIKSLLRKDAIVITELVKEKYAPKIEKRLKLNPIYEDKVLLQNLLSKLEKTPKQADWVLSYLQKVAVYSHPHLNANGIDKKSLHASKSGESSLKTLIKQGIFEEFHRAIPRISIPEEPNASQILLSEEQELARIKIKKEFETKSAVLLHGVTGSGKTEVYIRLIQEVLESGSQILLLLPEIGLTTQLVQRLAKVFGATMGVYHSRFSDNERVEVWKGVTEGRFGFVVGVRSAVFLPFDNLGLVIIDEEHDTSFKQQDPAPRYHARDAATYLAKLHNAKVLLGSATPSVETYHLADSGIYGLVELTKRYGEVKAPDIQLADARQETREKKMSGSFTTVLLEKIKTTLDEKKQAIIFQNRRGYAPYVNCEICSLVPECPSCDVSLTYHQFSRELRCHYCGHHEPIPPVCPSCGSVGMKPVGFGTEKLEEELALIFPNVKVKRMDQDTTRNKNAFKELIEALEKKEIDILVGTQMVSKGFDFEHVSLVGVLDVDRAMHYPDFRSSERVFQLLTQVSGRAGRRQNQGQVIIQTNQPQHPLLKKVIENDFGKFFKEELAERNQFLYPPFSRIIKVEIKNKDKEICAKAAKELSVELIKRLGSNRILGPEAPMMEKVRDFYQQEIWIKLERNKIDLSKSKVLIREEINKIISLKAYRQVYITVDVDPV